MAILLLYLILRMCYCFQIILWLGYSGFEDLILEPFLLQVLSYDHNQTLSLFVRLPFL